MVFHENWIGKLNKICGIEKTNSAKSETNTGGSSAGSAR
jgi:hypothetical protein